ncbi:NmrA family NAD(P)-binding protein [Mongoliitalea daihaiensis]|uniref:NmrA family NAD(P)-binding protein n=1 Tax=Mongoliitalea daihaiensis TaxID=2782006 RepID=UPI001F485AAC|nr:NAD-dependent epimerase/dehydratase family protein [Mongoliitalea daihaiensis]UJP64147.1 NAD-dependent epimerase/dehydratase family protein [Mongoliitalea daihaiensis]
MKKKIAIAGAGGYIGRWFIDRFKDRYDIVALSRREAVQPVVDGVTWKQVELFSITSTIEALEGIDYAIYLIHSMSASTRLNQGSFQDTDLLLADNFARAAAANKIEQILYLGGILPKDLELEAISIHLRSRLEVEETLASKGVPVTALRAGIIVGPGGSSFDMMYHLVQKLPVLVCPQWTQSETQAISLEDALTIMDSCLGNPNVYGRAFEIGSPEILTYKGMLEMTAKAMGKKRWIVSVPVFSVGFSKLWVSYFGKTPMSLVSPLVESLKHTLTVSDHLAFREKDIDYLDYNTAAKKALDPDAKLPALPPFKSFAGDKNTVRSIQRLPNTRHQSALWVANRYKVWLPTFFSFLINAKENSRGDIGFHLLNFPKPMLQLTLIPDRSDMKRQLFYITGGWLVKRYDYGWLEFREVMGGKYMISAIHEFVPRLPWFIYVNTQARIHLWVMNRFKKYLEKFKF